MNIRWTKPTFSGLGERLTDLLYLAAYARIRNITLYSEWPGFPAQSNIAPHRLADIRIENVLKFMRFPAEIVFDGKTQTEGYFNHSLGGGYSTADFYQRYLADYCSQNEFESVLKAIADEFVFCPEINKFLDSLPDSFVSLHIRRTDSVKSGQRYGVHIQTSELGRLNEMTYRAIDYLVAKGQRTFFLCGDDDESTAPFAKYIEEEKHNSVIKLPEMPKWQATYYDLAVMTRSFLIVASQRYSSFSRFPMLIGCGFWTTVFGMRDKILKTI